MGTTGELIHINEDNATLPLFHLKLLAQRGQSKDGDGPTDSPDSHKAKT